MVQLRLLSLNISLFSVNPDSHHTGHLDGNKPLLLGPTLPKLNGPLAIFPQMECLWTLSILIFPIWMTLLISLWILKTSLILQTLHKISIAITNILLSLLMQLSLLRTPQIHTTIKETKTESLLSQACTIQQPIMEILSQESGQRKLFSLIGSTLNAKMSGTWD